MVHFLSPMKRGAYLLALAAASFVSGRSAEAATYTLEDAGLNSKIVIDSSFGNIVDWFVEGVDQVEGRAYFFRVGAPGPFNPELAVDDVNLALSGVNQLDTNFDLGIDTVSLRFVDPNQQFRITTNTSLAAGLPGSNQATFTESLRIDNLSSVPLVISIFLAADYNLNGTAIDSSLVFGDPRSLTQVDAAGVIHESSVTVTPTLIQASDIAALGAVLGNAGSDNLSGSTSAGPGNLAYAFQWDLVIAPRRSWTLGNTNSITVPEASTTLLVGMGLAGGLFVARRRTR
jgi:hypothetical protein